MILKVYKISLLRDKNDPEDSAEVYTIEAETEREALQKALLERPGYAIVDVSPLNQDETWTHLGFDPRGVGYA